MKINTCIKFASSIATNVSTHGGLCYSSTKVDIIFVNVYNLDILHELV
jgi:hypothetical protein